MFEKFISPEHLTVEKEGTFTVHHSGGKVRYRTEDFLERNRDYLSADLINVMRVSSNPRLASIFVNKMTKTGHVTTDPFGSLKTNNQSTLQVPDQIKKATMKGKVKFTVTLATHQDMCLILSI